MIDLASPRAAWRIPRTSVVEIKNAVGAGWDVMDVKAPAVSDADGGSGSPEAIAAARGAEIYLGFGVPSGIAAAAKTADANAITRIWRAVILYIILNS